MSFFNLRNQIRKGEIKSAYYLYGSEGILGEILLKEIIDKWITTEEREHAVIKIDLKEASWEEIVNLLSIESLFFQRKVVVVKIDSGSEAKLPKDIEFLKNYLSSPNPSYCLVLIDNDKNGKGDLINIFQNSPSSLIFQMNPLRKSEVEILIIEKLKEEGKTISPSAICVLLEEAEEDLSLTLNDLEKLLIYAKDRKDISLEDITPLISFSKSYKVKDLISSIERRERAKSFKIMEELLSDFEPVFLLGAIAREFCSKYFSLLREQSEPYDNYISKEYDKKIKRIENILKAIFESDLKIKSSAFNIGIIEELIDRIIRNYELLGKKEI